jgi:protein-disulfide isomerase
VLHLRLKALLLTALLCFGGITTAAAEAAPALPPYGSDRAPYSFMVWGSLTCPFTRKLMPILKQIVDDSKGKVRLEWRHYPVHEPDPELLVIAQSDPQRFWQFAFAIMRALDAKPTDANYVAAAQAAAQAAGIDLAKVEAAKSDPAKWDAVKQDFLAARLIGVEFTPGVFFDGYFLTPKGVPLDTKAFEKSLLIMVQQAKS